MIKQFREFLLRGNLIDLAVAVVIGAAFTVLVKALVADIITPLIAAIGGKPDFSNLSFRFHNSVFLYGDLINAILAFLIVAAVIFFLIVKPTNAIMERLGRVPTETPVRTCPECLSDVPEGARKCAFCTSALDPIV
jgi:large conductance mechanosensitive channel